MEEVPEQPDFYMLREFLLEPFPDGRLKLPVWSYPHLHALR